MWAGEMMRGMRFCSLRRQTVDGLVEGVGWCAGPVASCHAVVDEGGRSTQSGKFASLACPAVAYSRRGITALHMVVDGFWSAVIGITALGLRVRLRAYGATGSAGAEMH